MARPTRTIDFMQYLAQAATTDPNKERLPSLSDLSKELNLSVASLREQVEVAKTLGLVESRPRTGMRRQPYSFFPAVHASLAYAMEVDPSHFHLFSDLRNHVEAAYWEQAVSALTKEDHVELKALMLRAWDKLSEPNIEIPHTEHRQLHRTIFHRLNNPFVLGLLEAYWEAYEAVGLSLFTDYDYLKKVWTYHQLMVDAVCAGDVQAGYLALVEHKDLLRRRGGVTRADIIQQETHS